MASYPQYKMFKVGKKNMRFEAHSWSSTKREARKIMEHTAARYNRIVPHSKGFVLYKHY